MEVWWLELYRLGPARRDYATKLGNFDTAIGLGGSSLDPVWYALVSGEGQRAYQEHFDVSTSSYPSAGWLAVRRSRWAGWRGLALDWQARGAQHTRKRQARRHVDTRGRHLGGNMCSVVRIVRILCRR